jgi:hypothetical protein
VATKEAKTDARKVVETIEYGDYHNLNNPDTSWQQGGFKLADGSYWEYREPGATHIVRNHRLRMRVYEVSRKHDHVQILDNAKHMLFSKRRFEVPENGKITFKFSVSAQIYNANDDDLYDGFVSVNLLDFQTGAAIDFFTSNKYYATVCGQIPFPGVPLPENYNWFCFFNEKPNDKKPGEFNDYEISYDQAADLVVFIKDGKEVGRQSIPFKITGFLIALGLMTEKDLQPEGSVSCHGQGITGEWSPFSITIEG